MIQPARRQLANFVAQLATMIMLALPLPSLVHSPPSCMREEGAGHETSLLKGLVRETSSSKPEQL